MLGTLHDKWDKSESVAVREGEKFITVREKRLEVKIEENNHLRLSLVETVDDKATQHHEATANVMNLLDHRRKDLAMVKQDLTEIMRKLANEDLKESEEEDLIQELRDKKAIKKKHESEIPKLEALKTVHVNYRVVKTGLTAVLVPGLTLHPEFLAEPVCWCPLNMPASHPVEETTSMSEVMPLISIENVTSSGVGLELCNLNEGAKFAVTTKDVAGRLCDVNVHDFVVESKEAEIKSSVVRKARGMYEVSYSSGAVGAADCEQIFLTVTYLGRHIKGSPYTVKLSFEKTSGKTYFPSKMGCCSSTSPYDAPKEGGGAMKRTGPFLVKRDTKYNYDIMFPSKPLHITLTSSRDNTDGYITAIDENCPVENAEKILALNSKLIYVNGKLVEGCDVTMIAWYLKNGKLPLRLTLVHPNGLFDAEFPDLQPETIVHMQESPK